MCAVVSGQLQAKFSLASGPSHPSTAVATFECEEASLSGLCVELLGSDFTMYLFKERCKSGEWVELMNLLDSGNGRITVCVH